MSVRLADVSDDIIDAMLTRSGGAVLRAPADAESGEYDGWRQGFSRRDVRRLTGAGLIARAGWAPDQLAVMFDGCHDMNADEFCSWWMTEGLRGLDQRAARRAGVGERERPDEDWADAFDDIVSADRVKATPALSSPAGDVPAWFVEWCGRTVHPPKLDALLALGAHRWEGAAAPRAVDAAWYPALLAKFVKRCAK